MGVIKDSARPTIDGDSTGGGSRRELRETDSPYKGRKDIDTNSDLSLTRNIDTFSG